MIEKRRSINYLTLDINYQKNILHKNQQEKEKTLK